MNQQKQASPAAQNYILIGFKNSTVKLSTPMDSYAPSNYRVTQQSRTSLLLSLVGSLAKTLARMGNKRVVDVSVSSGVVLVPVDGVSQAFVPGHLLPPAQLVQLIGVNEVTKIIEESVFHKSHHIIGVLEAHGLDESSGYVYVLLLIGAANVVDMSNCTLE
mmetsp:Transcript_4229/g.7175  ORF Transcript_4229/g.7175 Transcript_4229/m.7175 type:complete len:161 (+) Transcript_4229:47-529(+)